MIAVLTTHVIDQGTDQGTLIDRKMINVTYFDTFHLIARKVYE